ncbi:hypothetical protein ONZ45_g16087 [Pleurotus djamor]|nr:hypothetical protein ONZ45_g16087 [Pleurotus djamor]
MSTSAAQTPAQENLSVQLTEKARISTISLIFISNDKFTQSLSKEVSAKPSPTESPSRQALHPTQVGVATDDNLNNSTVASAAAKAQVDPAAADEKQADDGGKMKANAPTKKSAQIAQSKKKNQVEEKSKVLTLPEGARIICQDYSRLLLPTKSSAAETASVAPANDAVVDVKDVVAAGAKTKKTPARRKSTANLRASSSKDDSGATQPPAPVVKKAGRGKAKAIVDNDVDAADPSTKTKKAAAKKTVVDIDAPAEPKPKATQGKKAAAKKDVVPSISVRAATAGKGKGKAKEIKLSRFAPVAEGSNAVKRKAPEDDEAADEDRDAGDEDDARRPSKRAKVVA